jgi:hypothetical protein
LTASSPAFSRTDMPRPSGHRATPAGCTAYVPMLPDAPLTSTRWPARTPTSSRRKNSAVHRGGGLGERQADRLGGQRPVGGHPHVLRVLAGAEPREPVDLVARRKPPHARTDPRHDPGNLQPQRPEHADDHPAPQRLTTPHRALRRRHRRRAHLDQHVVLPGNGHGRLHDSDHLRRTEPGHHPKMSP